MRCATLLICSIAFLLPHHAAAGDHRAEARACLGVGRSTAAFLEASAGSRIDDWERHASTDPDARYLLGLCTLLGIEQPQDGDRGLELIEDAARCGVVEAQFTCGRAYLRGTGAPADAGQAFVWLSESAENGLAEAQFDVSIFYERGWVVARDVNLSLYWLELAARGGAREAQRLYLNAAARDEVAVGDDPACSQWIDDGVREGHPPSLYLRFHALVARQNDEDPELPGLSLLRQASEAGYAPAMYELAGLIDEGLVAGPEGGSARELLRAAARPDHAFAPAMLQLAAEVSLEAAADGIEPAEVRELLSHARSLLQRDSDAGSVVAMVELAGVLLTDPEDQTAEATRLLRRAALLGDAEAAYLLGILIREQVIFVADGSEARDYLYAAALQGHPGAQYELGLPRGEGGLTDNGYESVRWLTRAAEQGHAAALRRLARCYGEGRGVPLDEQRGEQLAHLADTLERSE